MNRSLTIFILFFFLACGRGQQRSPQSVQGFLHAQMTEAVEFTQVEQQAIQKICQALRLYRVQTSANSIGTSATLQIKKESCEKNSQALEENVDVTLKQPVLNGPIYYDSTNMNNIFSTLETDKHGIFAEMCQTTFENESVKKTFDKGRIRHQWEVGIFNNVGKMYLHTGTLKHTNADPAFFIQEVQYLEIDLGSFPGKTLKREQLSSCKDDATRYSLFAQNAI